MEPDSVAPEEGDSYGGTGGEHLSGFTGKGGFNCGCYYRRKEKHIQRLLSRHNIIGEL